MSAPRTYLAFDFGRRRIGVAVGNSLLRRARPLQLIDAAGAARFERIAALIGEWRPDALVLGIPYHPDGAEHDNTRHARAFGRQLQGRFRLPLHEVDERYTTTEARQEGARDDTADAAAAAIILDQYLRSLPVPEE